MVFVSIPEQGFLLPGEEEKDPVPFNNQVSLQCPIKSTPEGWRPWQAR